MTSSKNKRKLEANVLHSTLDALDVVREAFENAQQSSNITKRQLSDRIGRDPSYVSRVLNGRASNVNFATIARFLLVLGYWPTLERTKIEEMPARANYRKRDFVFEDSNLELESDWVRLNSTDEQETANIAEEVDRIQ